MIRAAEPVIRAVHCSVMASSTVTSAPGRDSRARRMHELLRPWIHRFLLFPAFPHLRPSAHGDCWRVPFRALDAPDLPEILEFASDAPAVLFFPACPWHVRWQRSNHIAAALARAGHGCISVNPDFGKQYPRPYWFDRRPRAGALRRNLAELHVRLASEPIYHDRLLTAAEEETLVEAVEALLARLGVTECVQIVSFPAWRGVVQTLRSRFGFPVLYDCHDYIAGFENIAPAVVRAETSLLELCDHALFSSAPLAQANCDRMPSLRERSTLVRNAVSAIDFGRAIPRSGRNRKQPLLGYVGALDHWFHTEMVDTLARALPECRIRLLGRIEHESITPLRRLPNVELPGEIPYDRLPGELAQFDVALIPFRRNNLTRAVNPIKLYEYFSMGLPVVSQRLPEVETYQNLAYLAETPEEFVTAVQNAVDENDPVLRRKRVAIAQRESWSARATQVQEVMGRVLAGVPLVV